MKLTRFCPTPKSASGMTSWAPTGKREQILRLRRAEGTVELISAAALVISSAEMAGRVDLATSSRACSDAAAAPGAEQGSGRPARASGERTRPPPERGTG